VGGQKSLNRKIPHFLLKHKKPGNLRLKSIHHLHPPVQDSSDLDVEVLIQTNDEGVYLDNNEYFEDEDFHDDDISDEVTSESSIDEENMFTMHYADFLNRLAYFHHVPQTTVQKIANEYLENALKSRDVQEKKLRDALTTIASVDSKTVEDIIKHGNDDDSFLAAQQNLNSEYKRTKFIQENFKYVHPVEIVLNKDAVRRGEAKDVIHYIPVTRSATILLEDVTLNTVFEEERNKDKVDRNVISDFVDGDAFKKNKFFKNNPGAYAAHFYSDSVEISNPLGAAKGKHKINQVFYTIAQIPKEQRSKIDRIQLCMVFKDKLIKQYGYDVIFKTLVEDLKKLEEGIVINYPVEQGSLFYTETELNTP